MTVYIQPSLGQLGYNESSISETVTHEVDVGCARLDGLKDGLANLPRDRTERLVLLWGSCRSRRGRAIKLTYLLGRVSLTGGSSHVGFVVLLRRTVGVQKRMKEADLVVGP